MNFALLVPPATTTDYILTSHKGEFFNVQDPVEAPFAVDPLPLPPTSLPRMMYLWVTSCAWAKSQNQCRDLSQFLLDFFLLFFSFHPSNPLDRHL